MFLLPLYFAHDNILPFQVSILFLDVVLGGNVIHILCGMCLSIVLTGELTTGDLETTQELQLLMVACFAIYCCFNIAYISTTLKLLNPRVMGKTTPSGMLLFVTILICGLMVGSNSGNYISYGALIPFVVFSVATPLSAANSASKFLGSQQPLFWHALCQAAKLSLVFENNLYMASIGAPIILVLSIVHITMVAETTRFWLIIQQSQPGFYNDRLKNAFYVFFSPICVLPTIKATYSGGIIAPLNTALSLLETSYETCVGTLYGIPWTRGPCQTIVLTTHRMPKMVEDIITMLRDGHNNLSTIEILDDLLIVTFVGLSLMMLVRDKYKHAMFLLSAIPILSLTLFKVLATLLGATSLSNVDLQGTWYLYVSVIFGIIMCCIHWKFKGQLYKLVNSDDLRVAGPGADSQVDVEPNEQKSRELKSLDIIEMDQPRIESGDDAKSESGLDNSETDEVMAVSQNLDLRLRWIDRIANIIYKHKLYAGYAITVICFLLVHKIVELSGRDHLSFWTGGTREHSFYGLEGSILTWLLQRSTMSKYQQVLLPLVFQDKPTVIAQYAFLSTQDFLDVPLPDIDILGEFPTISVSDIVSWDVLVTLCIFAVCLSLASSSEANKLGDVKATAISFLFSFLLGVMDIVDGLNIGYVMSFTRTGVVLIALAILL
jgi:hypothetical protein